jgi:predicted  nucleic acid-binding Zn-ribbon protein
VPNIKFWDQDEYDTFLEKVVAYDTLIDALKTKQATDVAAIVKSVNEMVTKYNGTASLVADMKAYDGQVFNQLAGLTTTTNTLKQADTATNNRVGAVESRMGAAEANVNALKSTDNALSIRIRPLEDALPGLRGEITVLQGRCDTLTRSIQDLNASILTKFQSLEDRLKVLELKPVPPPPVEGTPKP